MAKFHWLQSIQASQEHGVDVNWLSQQLYETRRMLEDSNQTQLFLQQQEVYEQLQFTKKTCPGNELIEDLIYSNGQRGSWGWWGREQRRLRQLRRLPASVETVQRRTLSCEGNDHAGAAWSTKILWLSVHLEKNLLAGALSWVPLFIVQEAEKSKKKCVGKLFLQLLMRTPGRNRAVIYWLPATKTAGKSAWYTEPDRAFIIKKIGFFICIFACAYVWDLRAGDLRRKWDGCYGDMTPR